MKTSTERMIVKKDGPIGWMQFNNPSRHNAVSIDMWRSVPEILTEFEKDDEVRTVIGAVKVCVHEASRDPEKRDLVAAQAAVDACFASVDYVEGQNAFLQKRKPAFSGR
jgi:enoyl-CoA hydratase/carnithine racemase